jgi:hypothetical protein
MVTAAYLALSYTIASRGSMASKSVFIIDVPFVTIIYFISERNRNLMFTPAYLHLL